jgi:DNA-binding MarR family transcriptional regulator
MKKIDYKLQESLGYIIGLARRAVANRVNHKLEKAGHDVTCEQAAILMNLWQKNGQSQKELAGCVCKDKASITRLIDGMEKRDLVVRMASKGDGRQKLIYLTSKGKELRQKLVVVLDKTIEDAQRGIKAQDLKICKDVLRQVTDNLSKIF